MYLCQTRVKGTRYGDDREIPRPNATACCRTACRLHTEKEFTLQIVSQYFSRNRDSFVFMQLMDDAELSVGVSPVLRARRLSTWGRGDYSVACMQSTYIAVTPKRIDSSYTLAAGTA